MQCQTLFTDCFVLIHGGLSMQLELVRSQFEFLIACFSFVLNVETLLFLLSPSGDLMEYVLSCFHGFCLLYLFYLEMERLATDL